jgi:hypothetical protein
MKKYYGKNAIPIWLRDYRRRYRYWNRPSLPPIVHTSNLSLVVNQDSSGVVSAYQQAFERYQHYIDTQWYNPKRLYRTSQTEQGRKWIDFVLETSGM